MDSRPHSGLSGLSVPWAVSLLAESSLVLAPVEQIFTPDNQFVSVQFFTMAPFPVETKLGL